MGILHHPIHRPSKDPCPFRSVLFGFPFSKRQSETFRGTISKRIGTKIKNRRDRHFVDGGTGIGLSTIEEGDASFNRQFDDPGNILCIR